MEQIRSQQLVHVSGVDWKEIEKLDNTQRQKLAANCRNIIQTNSCNHVSCTECPFRAKYNDGNKKCAELYRDFDRRMGMYAREWLNQYELRKQKTLDKKIENMNVDEAFDELLPKSYGCSVLPWKKTIRVKI